MATHIKSKFVQLAGAAALAAAAVGLAVPTVQSQGRELVQIDGSSTVYPVTAAVAEEFQRSTGGRTRVVVGVSGSGGGFKKFCRGETDISNASRPIKDSEKQACAAEGIEFVEMAIGTDALTVVINPQNNWAESMTVGELKKMWEPEAQGTIKRWNQVNPSWPDEPLNLYGPGADSGTFDYFTEAIVGEGGASRGDFTASEDDNLLVQGVTGDKNALAYFGFAYYLENQSTLKSVSIDGGNGPVAPTVANVEAGMYTPLSRPLFIYVSKKAMGKESVRNFVEFYLDNASELVAEVGYVARDQNHYNQLRAQAGL